MRVFSLLLALALTLTPALGCTGSSGQSPATRAAPTAATPAQTPARSGAPPVFEAVNYDGALRTRADLIGHPTVLWFFPWSGTPG
jgi:hypothetical protein